MNGFFSVLSGEAFFAAPNHRYKLKQESCTKPEKKFERQNITDDMYIAMKISFIIIFYICICYRVVCIGLGEWFSEVLIRKDICRHLLIKFFCLTRRQYK
jgi:hypothetical protein